MAWLTAIVVPSLDFRAAASIAENGREAWLPTRVVEIRNRKATRKVIRRSYPTLPGYVFVRVDAPDWRDDWHSIRAAEGVRGILANCGRPLTLSNEAVEALRNRYEAAAMMPVEASYRVGDVARVVDYASPFWGCEGVVEAADREAIRILLDIFGRKTRVEILGDRLERVA